MMLFFLIKRIIVSIGLFSNGLHLVCSHLRLFLYLNCKIFCRSQFHFTHCCCTLMELMILEI